MKRVSPISRHLLSSPGCRQRQFPTRASHSTGCHSHTRQYSLDSRRSANRYRLPFNSEINPLSTCLRRDTCPQSRNTSTARQLRAQAPGSVSDTTESMARKDKEKEKGPTFQLKVPKGTRDWSGQDVALREFVFQKITEIFKKHGAQTLDTPVFELKEILAGKYGEDSKLIYDLQDQGGELCSLRYDLTVPFARWLAMNPSVGNIKRYHIAKVYRRDQPAMTKGRMREFYQCDIDFAGAYDSMLPDAEICKITVEVFKALGLKDIKIKINHRRILDSIFRVSGVKDELVRPISSAVDKLDKSPWSEVRAEMLQKGIDEATADKIWEYVQLKGWDVLEKLRSDPLYATEDGKTGVDEMEKLLSYVDIFGAKDYLSFDLSLARGLDYYTGCIWEVVTAESRPPVEAAAQTNGDAKNSRPKKEKKTSEDDDRSDDPTVGVGSVAAGGRYDKLVGMFSGKGDKGDIPCVGISFGIDRILSVLKKRLESSSLQVRATDVDVYVMAFGSSLLLERMKICTELWDAGISAEYAYKEKARFDKQFKDAEKAGVPFAVILGEDELKKGEVKIKQLGLPDGHAEKNGVDLPMENLVQELKTRLAGLEERSLAARLNALSLS